MANDDRAAKQARIDELDAACIPPEERAEHVYDILKQNAPNLSQWDIVCFCVNYLGFVATGIMWLQLPAKHLARLVYTAHYMDEGTDRETGIEHRESAPASKPQHPATQPDTKSELARIFSGFDVEGERVE